MYYNDFISRPWRVRTYYALLKMGATINSAADCIAVADAMNSAGNRYGKSVTIELYRAGGLGARVIQRKLGSFPLEKVLALCSLFDNNFHAKF